MQSLDELWSSSEVRKLLKLLDSEYQLALEIIDTIPVPVAVIGLDLQVTGLNSRFKTLIERVPGFAGLHERAAESVLRDTDLRARVAAASSTKVPQTNFVFHLTP